MQDEEIEIRHRRHGFHDLGETDEPAPERWPRHVVCHQQCSHKAAPVRTRPVTARHRKALEVERRQSRNRRPGGHVGSWTTVNVRMPRGGTGDKAAGQVAVRTSKTNGW